MIEGLFFGGACVALYSVHYLLRGRQIERIVRRVINEEIDFYDGDGESHPAEVERPRLVA